MSGIHDDQPAGRCSNCGAPVGYTPDGKAYRHKDATAGMQICEGSRKPVNLPKAARQEAGRYIG